MLTIEKIEARKLKLVELVLTMTPENEARADRLEQIALCDMALKYLQVQDQEPVGCVLPDGLVLINAFPHLPANTNLYAAPVPAKEDHRESNSNPSPVHGQSKQGLTVSHTDAPSE